MAKSKKKIAKKGKKEKVVPAVMAPERTFRLDMEISVRNPTDGTTSYDWSPLLGRLGVPEDIAKTKAEDLKRCGVGGRLIHLDGSPDGVVIEEWFGVERMEATKEEEKKKVN